MLILLLLEKVLRVDDLPVLWIVPEELEVLLGPSLEVLCSRDTPVLVGPSSFTLAFLGVLIV